MRRFGDVADDVELVIHPVNKIDVRDAALLIHGFGAFGPSSAVCVGGAVVRTTISLDLHDHTRHAFIIWRQYDEPLSEQISGYVQDDRTRVKLAGQYHR